MRIFWPSLLITAALLQAANTLTEKEIAEGWVLLYDGKSLDNWNKIGGAPWRVAGDGDMLALRGGDDGWIMHPREFKDFVLKFEFQFPEGGRSAIFLRASAEGDPRGTGYAVEINNNDPKYATGSLAGIAAARPAAPEPNKWHTFEIQAAGDRIQVKLDGQSILDHRSSKSASGHIGFQYYKDRKIEFRNIRVKPL
jgi:hypothetical protein